MKSFWFFFFSILALLILMQIYVARGVHLWLLSLPLSAVNRVWIERVLLVLLFYFNLSIPARFVIRRFIHHDLSWLKSILVFPGTTWFITLIMMFCLFVVKDLSGWILTFFKQENVDASRRAFLQAAGAFSLGAPLILTGYGALKTARDYKIKRVEIPFKNLPHALDGFTIAQISDIHSGTFMNENEMISIREIMDSQHPQLAVMTGDFVDTSSRQIEPVARVFSKLKTDYGIFGCMGNHDLFDNYKVISAAMKDSGIVMLENGNKTLRVNGEALNLLGVNDSRLADLPTAVNGIDPDGFKVLLAHRPEFFPQSFRNGIDLQLSGHTHGGQLGLNFFGIPLSPMQIFHKYICGLYKQGKSFLYVNPGVGMVFAPIRIGVRPEITLITLRASSRAD
ncbi:metallophosphoesterase [bacterium]|nr:metallophosphoesterase [bacterium]